MWHNLIRTTWSAVVAGTMMLGLQAAAEEPVDPSSDAAPWPPEAVMVRQALEPIFAALEPKATIELDGSVLTFAYLPRTYKIHRVNTVTGQFDAQTHDEIGPSHKGIVLQTALQSLGTVNMAATPQTIRQPYWWTHLDVAPVGKTDKQIYWLLSYGRQTDEGVLKKIHQALADLGE